MYYRSKSGDYVTRYVTDAENTFKKGTGFIIFFGVDTGDNDEALLYYHPASKHKEIYQAARTIYQAVRLATTRTPVGALYRFLRLFTSVRALEDTLINGVFPLPGYYLVGSSTSDGPAGQDLVFEHELTSV